MHKFVSINVNIVDYIFILGLSRCALKIIFMTECYSYFYLIQNLMEIQDQSYSKKQQSRGRMNTAMRNCREIAEES